jgi:membrane protein implicated in regulation of membrane protease activity
MTFSLAVAWWVLAGALVAVELLTGTFYLLALALGAAAAAVAAHMNANVTAQLVAAAVVGGGSIALLHLKRARHPRSAPSQANSDVLLDIGQSVDVPAWDEQGTAQVLYRGAQWQARSAGVGVRSAGRHVIVAIQGNVLQLAPATDKP